MQSGRPSYTANYQPVGTGPYQVAVTQLLPGGLSATYWDNEWMVDAPAVQRVDAQVRGQWSYNAPKNVERIAFPGAVGAPSRGKRKEKREHGSGRLPVLISLVSS